MPALHEEPEAVKVVHQYGLGIHDEVYPDYLDVGWQQRQFLEYVDFAVEAEELGYDGLTLTEHHLPQVSNPSPHLLLANVAARTSRIRLGTAVTVLPFYNPRRAAEEAAMLDLLSDGRFELGIGRGNPNEYEHVTGLPAAESAQRFTESCELLELALTKDDFTFEGTFNRVTRPYTVTPKPKQKPLPIWVAAQSDTSIGYAAEKGWNVMRNFGDNQQHRAALDHYIEVGRQHGHELSGANFMVSRFVCVGASEDEARAGVDRILEIFSTGFPKRRGPHTGITPPRPPIICGTPDQVLAELRTTVAETGIRRLMVEAISLEETRLFAKEVLPALRELPAS